MSVPLTPRRAAAALAAVPLVLWLAVCVGMALMQERLLFPGAYLHGGSNDAAYLAELAADVHATPITLRTSDGLTLAAWHYAEPRHDRLVLFVHGNAADVSSSLHRAAALDRLGWNTLAFSLRGFRGSEGEPTEQGLALDLRAAWELATGPLGYAPDRVVLHGTSMGGGVLGLLLPELPAACAVMESTYASVRALAQEQYPYLPVSLLLRHPMDTLSRAPQVELPVLQVHSTADRTIPVHHARALAAAWKRGTYLEVPNLDHNQSVLLATSEGQAAWARFLESCAP